MNTQFLPSNYQIPSESLYMKLKDGENTFRVLSHAVVGYEYWNKDNKPVRIKKMPEGIPEDIKFGEDGNPTKIKHFWAFVVWNYDAQAVQILEITQANIQRGIKALVDNKRWGDPHNYDITIIKTGTGRDTKYVVQGNPPIEPIPEDIKRKYEAKKINLEALFKGENPLMSGTSSETFVEELNDNNLDELEI